MQSGNFIYKKFLGQHFIKNKAIIKKLIFAAELSEKDLVLEIGAGTGMLTEEILKNAKKVLAIEKDKILCEFLKKKFENQKNIEIICKDVLKLDPASYNLRPATYKIVANIPYYITGRLLRKIFEEWPMPKLIVLTLQKEVAKRICAKPPKMNLIAILVQYHAVPKIVGYVPKAAFRPQPKVDSAIIKIVPKSSFILRVQGKRTRQEFFKLVKLGFLHPRKFLIRNLSTKFSKEKLSLIFSQLNIKPTARAGEISLDTWLKIMELIYC